MRKPAAETYRYGTLTEGEIGQCPCCLRPIAVDAYGRIVRHGYTVDAYGWHNRNECPGWRKSPLENTDADAQAQLRVLRDALEGDIEEGKARAIQHHIDMVEDAIEVHRENPWVPGLKVRAIALTEFNKRNEQADEQAKAEARKAKATKKQLRESKERISREWERLAEFRPGGFKRAVLDRRNELRAAGPITEEMEKAEDYTYYDGVPDYPHQWNAKRRAKVVAFNYLPNGEEWFTRFDELAAEHREVVAALKAMK